MASFSNYRFPTRFFFCIGTIYKLYSFLFYLFLPFSLFDAFNSKIFSLVNWNRQLIRGTSTVKILVKFRCLIACLIHFTTRETAKFKIKQHKKNANLIQFVFGRNNSFEWPQNRKWLWLLVQCKLDVHCVAKLVAHLDHVVCQAFNHLIISKWTFAASTVSTVASCS